MRTQRSLGRHTVLCTTTSYSELSKLFWFHKQKTGNKACKWLYSRPASTTWFTQQPRQRSLFPTMRDWPYPGTSYGRVSHIFRHVEPRLWLEDNLACVFPGAFIKQWWVLIYFEPHNNFVSNAGTGERTTVHISWPPILTFTIPYTCTVKIF